jgi:pimeloyl-ACP methyl ester carboxylesterase
MTEPFAINGVELAWSETGPSPTPSPSPPTTPTLLLCHGFSGSSYDFAPHTGPLSATRRVLTLDQRGHGRSTKTGDVSSYAMAQFSADLVGFMEAHGGGPVDLLGHSMGGVVSLGAVLERPDLVHSLILMDTSAWSFLPPDPAVRTLVRSFMTDFDPARGVPSTLSMGGPEEQMIEEAISAELLAQREAAFAGMDPYAIKAIGMALLAEGTFDVRRRLGEITCPVTVIVGAHDHPLVDQAPDLAAGVAQGSVTAIEGAYHSPQLTHPEAWRHAVEAHLSAARPVAA